MMHKTIGHRRGALLFCKVIHQISRSHGWKNWRFDSNLRLLGRSQLSNPSDFPCSRSSVKSQGHTALKLVEFDPKWAFPDCNSSLNSPMAMKCCTKLETAKERCPIVFQGHPSNFKVTQYKASPILTQIGRFRTIGQPQLSNPSDLPCWRSSVKFQGHKTLKSVEFDPDWAFPDCNSSLNSPMATKWCTKIEVA